MEDKVKGANTTNKGSKTSQKEIHKGIQRAMAVVRGVARKARKARGTAATTNSEDTFDRNTAGNANTTAYTGP